MRWIHGLALGLAAIAVLCHADDKKEAAQPVQRAAIYDTMTSADLGDAVPALPVEGTWTRAAEGEMPATLQGDAVLVNHKLAAIIRKDGSGVDVYARGGQGWNRRGRLAPAEGKKPLKIEGLKATTNDGAAVGVQGELGGGRSLTFTLQTGIPLLKIAPEGAVERVRFEAPCRFGVLPDFFAADLVIDAKDVAVNETEIPTDNFFLHMLGRGEAILAAVWDKNVKDIEVTITGDGDERRIATTDVFFGKEGAVWCAVLEEEGIWHWTNLVKDDGLKGKVIEGWAVPFVAKWKGNFMKEDGSIESLPFIGQGWPGYHGGFSHKIDRSREKRGTYTASLNPARDMKYEAYRNAYVGYNGPMVAYPIGRLAPSEDDRRSNAPRTPLDRLCVDDLLRECLGTQACAYVLDVEARQMTNPGIFTCSYGKTPGYFIPVGPGIDHFKRAAETWKEDRAFMKMHTEGVYVFIKYIQDRINAYLDMRLEILAYLDEMEKKYPDQKAFIERLRNEMNKPAIVFQRPVSPDVRANGVEVFQPWMDEMMKALRIDTPEQAEKGFSATAAPRIGDPQDGRIRWMRRQVMVWRSMATLEMARNPAPGAVEIAKEIRRRTEATLRGGAGHEQVTVW